MIRRHLWRLVAVTAVGALVFLAAADAPGWVVPPSPPSALSWAAVAVAAGAAAVGVAWRLSRFAVTIVHELGHALCAALVGGRPVRISLAMDTSGLATWTRTGHWPFRCSLVAFSGYLAPPVAGYAGIAAVAAGNAYPWLALTASIFAATLFVLARSLVAVVVTVVVAGAAMSVTVWAPGATAAAATWLASVWLFGGVRSAYEHVRMGDLSRTDAGTVRSQLHIPARLVALAQLLAAVTVGVAAWLLLWRTTMR